MSPSMPEPTGDTRTRTAFLPFKGKAVRLSVLTLDQQDQLSEYLRFEYLQETRRQIDGLAGPLAEYAWDRAKEKADRIYPGRAEHAEHAFTFRGLAYTLHLAAQKGQPGFTLDDAAAAIVERGGEAVEAVRKCLGYQSSGDPPRNLPVPVSQIVHVLTNEPYCHTPQEVRDMTLEEIALIWAESESLEVQFTQSDQARIVEEWRKKRDREQLGLWGGESIWN